MKRIVLKYIRDFIKKKYNRDTKCYICGATKDLELHHTYSLSNLFWEWADKTKAKLDTVEDVTRERVIFEQDNAEALSNDNMFTLCKMHHLRLHTIYGQTYTNRVAEKVRRWVIRMKEKHDARQL